MKNLIYLRILQLVVAFSLTCCDENRPVHTSPSTKPGEKKTTEQKSIIPQKNAQPEPQSESLLELHASSAKAAFEAIKHKRKGERAEEGSTEFGLLLRQWNPSGKTVQEVKAIIGPPDWEKETAFGYRFDSGWGGWEWSLFNDGKVVMDVRRSGID